MTSKTILTFLFFILLSGHLTAQPYYFRHYQAEDGLSGTRVLCSLQDKKGNLWFGHGNGICKFDGKNFYQFQMDNMHVFAMLEDKKGDLWLCTFKSGVYKYDGHTFTNFTDKQGLGSKIVSDVAEDQHGNLWFGTFGGGLVKYDGRNFTHFTTKGGLNDNDIYAIEIDRNENMWIGYFSYGASKFDGQYFTHYTDRQGLVFNGVRSIMEDKKGNLWFGTYSGLSRMDNVYASSTKNLPGPYFKKLFT